jgi:hypothetical protein
MEPHEGASFDQHQQMQPHEEDEAEEEFITP